MGRWLVGWLCALCAAAALAHESRPAYLEINETAPGRYDLLWRTPLLSGMPLPVVLQLPEAARELTPPSQRRFPESIVERRLFELPGGLAGQRIRFHGLQATITDVLVRVQRLDGAADTHIVRPSEPWLDVAQAPNALTTAGSFFVQGVTHIALGVDHLLFVLALLLIVRSPLKLIKSITAFTVAHSITLALATLGHVRLPGAPVEATIALSILFLAPEIVRQVRGQTSFTIRHPWVVAFAFGLLHGFGFAGALREVGLPQHDIPLALLSFNLGVEAGQLVFVGAVLLLMHAFRALRRQWPQALQLLPAYAIGAFGAFWTLQRMVMMLLPR